jgi:hypothetical protein
MRGDIVPTAYYKCNKCSKMLDTLEDAAACEESHLTATSVTAIEYRFGPYPFRVVLRFSDGEMREYVKQDIPSGHSGSV